MTHVVDGGGGNVIKKRRELTWSKGFWRFFGEWEEVFWRIKWRGRAHGSQGDSRESGFHHWLTREGHEGFCVSRITGVKKISRGHGVILVKRLCGTNLLRGLGRWRTGGIGGRKWNWNYIWRW